MRLVVDTIEYGAKHLPQYNTISISGYHIREAGSTAAQELAFTLVDGLEYVRWSLERLEDRCVPAAVSEFPLTTALPSPQGIELAPSSFAPASPASVALPVSAARSAAAASASGSSRSEPRASVCDALRYRGRRARIRRVGRRRAVKI